MEKLKIMFIAETMEAGVRRHVVDVIKGLNKDIYSISLIYGNRVDSIFLKELDAIKNYTTLIKVDSLVREIDPIKDIRGFLAVRRAMKAFRPDIVHCHSSKAGVIGRISAKSLRIKKIIYTPHAYSFLAEEFSTLKKFIFINIEKLLSKTTTTFTFNVSEGERQEALIRRIDNINKFKVIYNGLPLIDFPDKANMKKELGLPADSFIIGNNARLSEAKNPMLFMSIARKVTNENPNIHFVYAGDGPLYDSCKEYIEEHELENHVHLLGFREDAETLVSIYDMFLITSTHEGLPYSLLESMRACVPILGFSVTGVEEVISDNNGILISSEKEASDVILESYTKNIFSKELIYSIFESKFSIDKMLRDIHAMYIS